MAKRARKDSWDSNQYNRFIKERELPFFDLLKEIDRKPGMRIVDLGCGNGRLTRSLHEALSPRFILGIDSSASMLKEASSYSQPSLQFQQMRIEDFHSKEDWDLIFSNAALQWVPNHPELFEHLSSCLSPHGQLAVQMPANFDFPSHTIAMELANHSPFKEHLDAESYPKVLLVEDYSELLFRLGFKRQRVCMQIYPLVLSCYEDLIEWVKGSLLTHFKSQLPSDLFEFFLELYRDRVRLHFKNDSPLFVPFKRILLNASL